MVMCVRKAISTPMASLLMLLALTSSAARAQQPDPLPSWANGETKAAIIEFLNDVTKQAVTQCPFPAIQSHGDLSPNPPARKRVWIVHVA